jgi:hypothetical protein
MNRRERTHHLIELGGLVKKAGLVDLTGDDRSVLYGAFLTISMVPKSKEREHSLALQRRRGQRAFEVDGSTQQPADRQLLKE